MKKTIKEWLMELPDGYRELAFENTDEEALSVSADSLAEALSGSFYWEKTKQGTDFWHDVYRHYLYEEPLPPLPPPPPRLPNTTTISAKTNAQIFDEVASKVMVEYSPDGFKKKFATLHKAIMIAMEEAVRQSK